MTAASGATEQGPESPPVCFCNSDFKTLPSNRVEKEGHDAISKGRHYPVRVGDIKKNKPQVDRKLGKCLGSTVWLANEFRKILRHGSEKVK